MTPDIQSILSVSESFIRSRLKDLNRDAQRTSPHHLTLIQQDRAKYVLDQIKELRDALNVPRRQP